MLQDAHELLLDLINSVSDLLEAEEKARQQGLAGQGLGGARQQNGGAGVPAAAGGSDEKPPPIRTWVHDLFQASVWGHRLGYGCQHIARCRACPLASRLLPLFAAVMERLHHLLALLRGPACLLQAG